MLLMLTYMYKLYIAGTMQITEQYAVVAKYRAWAHIGQGNSITLRTVKCVDWWLYRQCTSARNFQHKNSIS